MHYNERMEKQDIDASGVKVDGLEMSYFGSAPSVQHWSFELPRSGRLCIFGMHNQGKTALLRALAGLEEYRGSIRVGGKEVRDIPVKETPIAFSFDFGSLMPRKTALQNIVRPLELRKADEGYVRTRLAYVTRLFDIEDLLNAKVKDLTPAQCAKVLLARIFVRECELYLVDDVFSGMGYTSRREAFDAFVTAVGRTDATVIYATDRMYEARMFGGKIAVVYGGIPQQIDEYYRLYSDPGSLSVVRSIDDYVGVIGATLKKGENGWTVNAFGHDVKAPEPISDTYANKRVLCCVYPEFAVATADPEGEWTADRSISTKSGRLVRFVRDDGIVYVKNADIALGARASVRVFGVGNMFDRISEFKINKEREQ